MEVPSKVEYNILIIVTGVAIDFISLYPPLSSFITYPFTTLLWSVGGILIVMGLAETRYTYYMDKRIKELETAKQINDYISYFNNKKINDKNILFEENKTELLRYMRELIKGDEPI